MTEDEKIQAEISSLKQQLKGIEKSIEVAHDDFVRVPTEVQKQISALKELHEEKFKRIDTCFEEDEKRYKERFEGQEIRLKERFESQEKAISKSEFSFAKQLDSTNEKVGDNKDRITRIEGVTAGNMSQKTDQKTSIGLIVAIVFGVLAFLSSTISILINLNHK